MQVSDAGKGGWKPLLQTEKHIAEIAQLVEHNLAKVGVASSSLVFRSENQQLTGIRLLVFCLPVAENRLEKAFLRLCLPIASP